MKQLQTGVRTYEIGGRIEVLTIAEYRAMQLRELKRKRSLIARVKDWFNSYTYQL